MTPGNPYHGIFVLDEKISNASTEQELYEIRSKVKKNRKYSLDTKKMIYKWIYWRLKELQFAKLPYAVRMKRNWYDNCII